jgi:glycosyltransferase involved in cell wall biosynthesis
LRFCGSKKALALFFLEPSIEYMKIKVLHIIKSLGRGGAEMLLPETLKLHDQSKFEFHYIYFLPWKDQMVQALEETGGIVNCFSANNNIQLMLQLPKVLNYMKANNIQLIHAHLPWAGFLSRFIYKLKGVPVLYTEHNKQERYHGITFRLNKQTFNWQTTAIAVSGDVAASIHQNIQPTIAVKTILNGVNTEVFQRQPLNKIQESIAKGIKHSENDFKTSQHSKEVLNFDDGERVLKKLIQRKKENPVTMVVGNLAVFRFQKRLLEWVHVFHEARKSNPNMLGVIVGNGPFAEQLLQLRDELGLKEHLFLPGLQTNTLDWFSIMDVFMMTSEFEGLPIALLEAMSMECAIVTTDAGGVKEVIEDGKSGLMVGVDDWKSLAEKLEMLKDEALRTSLSHAARKRVVEAFSMKRMVNELEELYSSTIK